MIHAKRSNQPTAQGIKEALEAGAQAGYVTTVAVDNAGMANEAHEIADQHGSDRFVAFRMAGDRGGFNMDVPGHNYQDDPAHAADEYLRAVLMYLPPEHDERTWVICWNEIDKHRLEYCADVAYRMMVDPRVGNLRLMFMGLNSGEPEPDQLDGPLFKQFANYCQRHRQQFGLAIHEYSMIGGQVYSDMRQTVPWTIGRCHKIVEKYPGMTLGVTEFGWGKDQHGFPSTADAAEQLEWAVKHYKNIGGEIRCLALWYDVAGNASWGSIGQNVSALVPDMARITAQNVPYPWEDDGTGPTPPPDSYKAVVVKIAQEHTKSEWREIAAWSHDNYKRDQTASHDTARNIIQLSNHPESYALVVDPHLDSQKMSMAHFEQRGIRYETITMTPPPPDGWLPEWTADYWPTVDKRITQPFGANPDYYGQFGLPGHEGVDIAAQHGAPIYAIAAGTVYRVENQDDSAYGFQVRIRHGNGYRSIYAHHARNLVSEGQQVSAGQKIAEADNTGNSTGSHLHLTIKYDGATQAGLTDYPHDQVDPMRVIHPGLPVPSEPTPPSGNYYMPDYFWPLDGQSGSDIFMLKTSWAGSERTQILVHNGDSYITKNALYEQRRIIGNAIHLLKDTSPDAETYYTITTPDGWLPLRWNIGHTFTRVEHVKRYRKADCGLIGEHTWTTQLRFVNHYPTWKSEHDVHLRDVIELEWLVAGNVDERYWYAAGLGLVQWRKVAAGQLSSIEELIPRGMQHDNEIGWVCDG